MSRDRRLLGMLGGHLIDHLTLATAAGAVAIPRGATLEHPFDSLSSCLSGGVLVAIGPCYLVSASLIGEHER